MTHEQILKMLQGKSAGNPMGFVALVDASGLQPDTLNMVLDQMYDARKINQAKVTRGGVVQRVVWPTGVVSNQVYLNSIRKPPTPPLRPAEVKPKLMEETMNPELKPAVAAEQKPRALQVLEFIEANPSVSTAKISQAFEFASPVSYIKKHVQNKKVIAVSTAKRSSNYTIADGFTAASIYGNGFKNNHGHKAKAVVIASRAEDKAMLDTDAGKELVEKAAAASEEYEVPAFLRKSEIVEKPKLKIAYTNQKTIMLFGLTESPIELSKEDSDELIDFCAQMDFCNSEAFALS